MSTFESRSGDNNITYEVQLTRKDGTPQPLTGSETGSFIFSDWTGTDQVTKTLVVSDAPNSKVKCTLLTADSNTRKGQVLRVRIPLLLATGLETFPTADDDLLWVIS